MPEMRVTICGPNLNDQSKGTFHVHAEGCGDLKRGARREPEYLNGWTIDASSVLDIALDVYPPDQFDWDPADEELREIYLADFHLFGCCSSLPLLGGE